MQGGIHNTMVAPTITDRRILDKLESDIWGSSQRASAGGRPIAVAENKGFPTNRLWRGRHVCADGYTLYLAPPVTPFPPLPGNPAFFPPTLSPASNSSKPAYA